MDSGIKCTLSKFANDTKLCGVVNRLEGRDAIQRDLNRLERWARANRMKFNKAKCKVLHMGQGNPKHNYGLGREWIESSPEKKDLRVLGDKNLNMTHQRALAAQKVNLLHPALGCPGQERHGAVGASPEEATKMISYEDWLRELGLFSLEKRRLQGDITAAFQYLKGAYGKAGEGLFTRACRDSTRVNGFKVKEGRFRLDIKKKFFTIRVVRPWHRLPREVVDAPSLEVFKSRLDGASSNLV
ncbi:triadin [Grus japonensis]|uniref:Triadin n=1 Tax=Grus japonensis TaxID=30415 RepID=A0ABC9XIM1_GRUJA